MRTSSKIAITLTIIVCFTIVVQTANKPYSITDVTFKNVANELGIVDKNELKFAYPIIADLNNDGYFDLILETHDDKIDIYWNSKGQKFTKTQSIITGDVHGIALLKNIVGQFTRLFIATGGGIYNDGYRPNMYVDVSFNKEISENHVIDSIEGSRGRAIKLFDTNNDNLPELAIFSIPHVNPNDTPLNGLYEFTTDEEFAEIATISNFNPYSLQIKVLDYNNDGNFDILAYGSQGIEILRGNGDGTYENVTNSTLKNQIKNVSSIAEIDYDNDGDFDLFISRAYGSKDYSEFNSKDKIFGFTDYKENKELEFKAGEVLYLENYQAIGGKDAQNIYLGEQKVLTTYSGEPIEIRAESAKGWPNTLTENGAYIGYIGNGNWKIAGNHKFKASGILRPVVQAQVKTETVLPSVLLENVEGKYFRDVTTAANVEKSQNAAAAIIGDFDNNGYDDIISLNSKKMTEKNVETILFNNGDGTFTSSTTTGIFNEDYGSFGLGGLSFDFDLDGALDVLYGRERGKWHIYKNTSQKNDIGNYTHISVFDSPKDKTTNNGAMVTLQACDNTQTKRVGMTDTPYSQGIVDTLHFGIGSCQRIDSISVQWRNGESAVKKNIKKNSNIEFGSR